MRKDGKDNTVKETTANDSQTLTKKNEDPIIKYLNPEKLNATEILMYLFGKKYELFNIETGEYLRLAREDGTLAYAHIPHLEKAKEISRVKNSKSISWADQITCLTKCNEKMVEGNDVFNVVWNIVSDGWVKTCDFDKAVRSEDNKKILSFKKDISIKDLEGAVEEIVVNVLGIDKESASTLTTLELYHLLYSKNVSLEEFSEVKNYIVEKLNRYQACTYYYNCNDAIFDFKHQAEGNTCFKRVIVGLDMKEVLLCDYNYVMSDLYNTMESSICSFAEKIGLKDVKRNELIKSLCKNITSEYENQSGLKIKIITTRNQ